MRVDAFDFTLPDTLIAQHPVNPRDAARLLVVNQSLQDQFVKDLPAFLAPGDLLVFNNTKVIPARLHGKRGQVTVEVLLHQPDGDLYWNAFARPAKRLKIGDVITFAEGFEAKVFEKQPDGQVKLLFESTGDLFFELLQRHGLMPLPPYIARSINGEADDWQRYQTVYAKHEGAVAAPTAGLHFTPTLLERLKAEGVGSAFVTLHVGAGTFQPVKVENTEDHVMHRERGFIDVETANLVNTTKRAGGKIIAVGTTSLRTLESMADEHGIVHAGEMNTGIFITPGYRFKVIDRLLTNFHLPRSTLFMLVSAFSGLERMHEVYRHAMEHSYRFYSYGDACLLTRSDEC